VEDGGIICQGMSGQAIDKKIAELLIVKLTPEVVAQSVEVQKEMDNRQDESLNYYQMRVEKCRYEAELARKRFMNVDPDNRLVALELESAWNIKLKNLDDARTFYDSQAEKNTRSRSERDYALLDNLSRNFATVFQSREISHKDKKRMVRYLIEDIILTRSDHSIRIDVRYKGHTTQSVIIDAPKQRYENCATSPDVIKFIDQAAQTKTVEEITTLLNQSGYKSGMNMFFMPNMVKQIMYAHSIPNLKERYLDQGYVICTTKAASLGISASALMAQIRSGRYQGEYVRVNSRNECVFPPEYDCDVNYV